MKTDWDYIEYWCLLFEQEKSLVGITREVFDQSFEHLKEACWWDCQMADRSKKVDVADKNVRRLMIARLPLYLESLVLKSAAMLKLNLDYVDLKNEAKVGKHLDACCIYCCQSLHLDLETTDKMKRRILAAAT